MLASTLEEAVKEFDEALGRADFEVMFAFHEDDAAVVVEPGRLAVGNDELAGSVCPVFALKRTATQIETSVLESRDITLFTSG